MGVACQYENNAWSASAMEYGIELISEMLVPYVFYDAQLSS